MGLTIGSLFSGIGGLELGLEACGLGPVLWQAEIDPFCRAVLAKHWPDARRYEDVREIDATTERPDVICGGFPCQDLSLAGKQGGLSADRSGLWWEFRRIVRVLRPRFVVVENVHGAWRKWLPVVRRGLWKVGYASLPIRVRASDVGAPHERARVFVVAHADRDSVWEQRRRRSPGPGTRKPCDDGAHGDAPAHAEGGRIRCGRGWSPVAESDGLPRLAANAECALSERSRDGARARGPEAAARVARSGASGTHPDANGEGQLQPRRMLPDQWGRSSDGDGWNPEPVLRGSDYGDARGLDRRAASRHRAAREKALGNAVVPQAAKEAWLTAMELTGWAP